MITGHQITVNGLICEELGTEQRQKRKGKDKIYLSNEQIYANQTHYGFEGAKRHQFLRIKYGQQWIYNSSRLDRSAQAGIQKIMVTAKYDRIIRLNFHVATAETRNGDSDERNRRQYSLNTIY